MFIRKHDDEIALVSLGLHALHDGLGARRRRHDLRRRHAALFVTPVRRGSRLLRREQRRRVLGLNPGGYTHLGGPAPRTEVRTINKLSTVLSGQLLYVHRRCGFMYTVHRCQGFVRTVHGGVYTEPGSDALLVPKLGAVDVGLVVGALVLGRPA